ncbi:MAG: cobalt-precorrin-5B (C(1))-methyltransferase CbiD [Lachnospiraceae bacterium]|nr:cobalt-precorrin-5B (C(1))-methyltransferase CbiD [Lachnospiraceae bacterium]
MEDKYIFTQGKRLRCGYTTGTCAQAAAGAAAVGFFTGEVPQTMEVTTPDGTKLALSVEEARCGRDDRTGRPFAVCAVRKDAGDDIDVTDGMLVFARVTVRKEDPVFTENRNIYEISGDMQRSAVTGQMSESQNMFGRPGVVGEEKNADPDLIRIIGGIGVGRVTKPGLDQPVGEAAINSVPRRMIRAQVAAVMEEAGEEVPLDVEIFLPDGEERAKKTMNERLGILGGLSVLGTTGIVEPQSHRALIETIRAELSMRYAAGERNLLITPGNYGMKFIEQSAGLFRRETLFHGEKTENGLPQTSESSDIKKNGSSGDKVRQDETGIYSSEFGSPAEAAVKCSNFIGDTLDAATEFGFAHVTLVGHIGKLVKLAGGMLNTHSMYGDCRMELLAACGLKAGVPQKQLMQILDCVTCDDALGILAEGNYLEPVMKLVGDRILYHLRYRCKGKIGLRVVVFSNVYGVLADRRDDTEQDFS